MAKINTEKPSRKIEQKKIGKMEINTPKLKKTEIKEETKISKPKEEKAIEKDVKQTQKESEVGKGNKKEIEKSEKLKEEKTRGKKEPKKEKSKTIKPKKTEVFVNAKNVPISTKHSMAICKFIKYKKIEDAMNDLEQVLKIKKAVPMKGEIPHRKGKGMSSGSGRFPVKSAKNFIVLLKSLSGNAAYNGIEEPIIIEAVANLGKRPYGRFGRVRKKRTHVKLVAKSKLEKKK